MKQQNEMSVRHVQTKLTQEEYSLLERYASDHGVSMGLAVRGILVDVVDSKGHVLPEGIQTTRERNFVRRVLSIFRSQDKVCFDALTSMIDALERAALRR